MKAKVFVCRTDIETEDRINEWIERENPEIVEIVQSSHNNGGDIDSMTIVVTAMYEVGRL